MHQEPDLFTHLFNTKYKYVYNRVNNSLKNHEDSEEITSDIFMKIYKHIDQWEENFDGFEAWLNVVIKNTTIDKIRKLTRLNQFEFISIGNHDYHLKSEYTSPENFLIREEAHVILESALLKVKNPNHRIAYILCYLENYSTKEISVILKRKPSTVKIWIHRCKEELRDIIQTDFLNN